MCFIVLVEVEFLVEILFLSLVLLDIKTKQFIVNVISVFKG